MKRLQFYEVEGKYIDYLYNIDKKVPKVDYSAEKRHEKFLCGIVLSVNGHNYFAPISSFKKQQRTNIIIRDRHANPISSIRFSFMIPVPNNAVKLKDISAEPSRKYQFLLYDELRFCNDNVEQILRRAEKIYADVVIEKNPFVMKNCCDFVALESACAEYVKSI
jgi:protein AbiQ